jgi:hypothetical protein
MRLASRECRCGNSNFACTGVSSERAFGICTPSPTPCDPARPESWPWPYCHLDGQRCHCVQLASPLGWSPGTLALEGNCLDYLARYGPDHVRCTPYPTDR